MEYLTVKSVYSVTQVTCVTTMPTAMRPQATSACVTMVLLGTELTVKVYVCTYMSVCYDGFTGNGTNCEGICTYIYERRQ